MRCPLGFKATTPDVAIKRRAEKYRIHIAAVLCVAFTFFVISPWASYFTRLGGDFMTPLAAHFARNVETQSSSPVVVVVIDEITHNTPPFSETPEVAWTPYLGEVISAIDDAGSKVIGLDMIYPKTLSGRDLAPGYDRSFLQAIAKAGRDGGLILGETKLSATPIRPYRGQEIAVGGAVNIRSVQLTPDPDNVVRRHPAFLPDENGGRLRSFAAEISTRLGSAPERDIIIDFVTRRDHFPTYRFSDLYRCIEAGATENFDLFAGKAVLIGTALDIEDRHVAGNRLQRHKDFPIVASPCATDVEIPPVSIYRASTSGVFIEARAVNTFYTGAAPTVLNRLTATITTMLGLSLLAAVFFRIGPAAGFAVLSFVAVIIGVAGAKFLSGGVLTPALPWIMVATFLFVAIYSYRVILEDQSKRWVTHAFRHYLSPTLVSQLASHPETLQLGGERRHVAVLFADLAGFTTTSEEMSDRPEALVAHLNAFFEIMTSNIQAHGGYIDKFVGDAVMGVWGAPVAMESPERAAAESAIACRDAIDAWNDNTLVDKNLKIKMRIGVSAGEVIAGNLGSKDRFNYTVIGDAVNRAARLEQENKRLKTTILVDGAIAERLPPRFGARLLEEVSLRGQRSVTKIYALEPETAPRGPESAGEI